MDRKVLHLRKGMWIWQWDRVAQQLGGAEGVARLLQRLGADHVCVKIADGTRAPYWHGRRFGAEECKALRDAGLFVWGWQYTYGKRPEREAAAFLRRAEAVGVDGLIIDAEQEYKGHADRARRYCAALDTTLPVALSSYYVPSYHASFPWRAFAERADIIMPQVYWAGHSVEWAVGRAVRENSAFGKPLQLTYAITPELCRGVDKLRQGHELADKLGLCVNYWLLDGASQHYLDAIAKWRPGQPGPGYYPGPVKVVLLPDNRVVECAATFDGGQTRCDLRALAEALGATVHDHIRDQRKVYIMRPASQGEEASSDESAG